MSFDIHPRKVLKFLLCVILFLLCANVLGLVSKLYFDRGHIYGLIPMFNFNFESNIPTLYSSLALLLSSALLLFIALTHRKKNASYLHWGGLAIIFLFLSMDEILSIHERLIIPLRAVLNTSGMFYYAWVIPYGLALILFIIAYLKFLINLPRNIMILFVISGSIFVSGAIGFELAGGWQADLHGTDGLLYSIFFTIEELLEMLGIALFIYTLLTYITCVFKHLAITISNTENEDFTSH